MNNFTYYVPTKVYFGKGQISHLVELKESGSKVLLVYGGGSIKKLGLYNTVMALLRKIGLKIYELPGIEPNPRIESVRKGVRSLQAALSTEAIPGAWSSIRSTS